MRWSLSEGVDAMLSPLLTIPLQPDDIVGALVTDETTVALLLFNQISDALKFVKHDDVRMSASFDTLTGSHDAEEECCLAGTDTGTGIAPGNLEADASEVAPSEAQEPAA